MDTWLYLSKVLSSFLSSFAPEVSAFFFLLVTLGLGELNVEDMDFPFRVFILSDLLTATGKGTSVSTVFFGVLIVLGCGAVEAEGLSKPSISATGLEMSTTIEK